MIPGVDGLAPYRGRCQATPCELKEK
uniref:Uncharacterized protein n=1 Tax=Anguilla anguilla TaxID=7936 RepID=A0A0E9VJI7_ANGAN